MAVSWWDLPGAAPAYSTRRDPTRDTYGPEVCKIMRRLSVEPMPWQQHVLDVAFEHVNGKLVYRQVCAVVPRQAGKTLVGVAIQVHRSTTMARRLKQPQRSLYTAQRHTDARAKLFEEHHPMLDASVYGPHVTLIRTTSNEGLKWDNGSWHHIAAPSWKAGHGGSIDLVHVDEAFVLESDEVEQGVKPTQITRRSPQMWVTSAAGTHRSTYLRSKVEVGRELARTGQRSGTCYFEWSADGQPVDPMNPRVWAEVHPAIGFTIDADAIAADVVSMKPEEFARAYLAIWPTLRAARIVPEELWSGCVDGGSVCGDPVYFAVDVSPSREMAAVSVAGRRPDGRSHVELVRHDHGAGWVAPFVQDLLARHPKSTVSVDTVGSAASLLPDLERRRVPVRMLTTSDVARSMGMFLDQIAEGRLRHRDQVALNVALGSAGRRRIGDKWAWARGDSDITALVSATLALWSMETTIEPKKFKMGLAQ